MTKEFLMIEIFTLLFIHVIVRLS